jgi:hypothetical protein
MNTLFRWAGPATLVVATLLSQTAGADEVFLKSGGRLSGRIVSRTSTTVVVEVGAGKITVPTSSVVKIEEGKSALQEYEERAGRLSPGDADGWVALAEWASSRALGTQAREAYERALKAAPNDPRPNQALGNVQLDGRWVTQEDGYRAQGYVQFEGEWMAPAERDAIVRERAADNQQRHAQQQSELAAREAETRAQEAEAKAREAEAASANDWNEGIPLWYGWGAGPVYWPSRPVVTHPIARPVTRTPAAVPR